jgi:hypothetical protein
MTSRLEAILNSVNDEQSFLQFLQALAEDWEDEQQKELAHPSSPYGSGANGWENGTIGAYLDAAGRWGNASIDGLIFYEKPSNPWQRAAQILHMGKLYE